MAVKIYGKWSMMRMVLAGMMTLLFLAGALRAENLTEAAGNGDLKRVEAFLALGGQCQRAAGRGRPYAPA